ncbi:MAG TPA: cysteine hydrolase [bacterium]|jgi:nicotinamidase-related amidase|nr:cysteine hydrolase [bacterium]
MDPKKTAVLSLDIQEGLLGFVPGAAVIFPRAAQVIEASRKGGFPIFHVGIGFEPGYPEISPANKRFMMVKERGLFVKGSDSAKIHPSIFKPGDTVIYKHRVGAFAGNSLLMILHSQGIENLVFFGISTSGIVLSTLRAAADLDFQCTVVKDACFDPDEEVHRVLTEKVFAAQATVIMAQEFQTGFAGA